MSGTWSQASINKNMAAFIGRCALDIPATSSGTVTTYFMYRATIKFSWAFYCSKTVKAMNIDHNGHIALWLTMKEGQHSLTLHWRSFSTWGKEHFTSSFSYKGSLYFVHDCLQPVTPQITEDTWPTIVDAQFTLIFMMGQGGYHNLFYL